MGATILGWKAHARSVCPLCGKSMRLSRVRAHMKNQARHSKAEVDAWMLGVQRMMEDAWIKLAKAAQ